MKIYNKGKSKYLWLLDAGHGGLDPQGNYVTPGKRSPVFDGEQIFEGVINRQIVSQLHDWLLTAEIAHCVLSPGYKDKPLRDRTDDANNIFSKNKEAVLVSVHCNAGRGTGIEVFTSPGQTESDAIATKFIEEAKMVVPDVEFREDWSDNDPDKEAKFWVLTQTSCPAILTENLFMDTRKDFDFLNSERVAID